MAIDVQCAGCRADFQVPDRLAGKLVRCKTCGKEFRVGGDEPAEDYDDEPRPRRRPVKSSSSVLVALVIVGGLLTVCGLVAVVVIVYLAIEPRAPQPFAVPVPQAVGRRVPANAILPDYTIMPPRAVGGAARAVETPEGPIVVTLSNPRRAESMFPGQPAYQVDLQTQHLPAGGTDWYYLMVKVPAGIGEVHLSRFPANPNGPVSFTFFPGSDPGQGFDIWIERRPFGKPAERKRVSKVVTLN